MANCHNRITIIPGPQSFLDYSNFLLTDVPGSLLFLIVSHSRVVVIEGDIICRDLLRKCAATAMSSKLIHQQKDHFSKMVVDAVLSLDAPLLPLDMIGTCSSSSSFHR